MAAPPQARSPWDSPSVWVHLPDSHAPTSAPTPNPGNLAPDSQGSPPPAPLKLCTQATAAGSSERARASERAAALARKAAEPQGRTRGAG